MTKKPDNRREADDEEIEDDAQRFRIDRVFIPAKREASGPVATGQRPLRPPAAASTSPVATTPGSSPGIATPAIAEASESEFRRQLSKLQRSLSDAQGELANREEQLAAELERRVAQAKDHDDLLAEHATARARLEELSRSGDQRGTALEAELQAARAQQAALVRERDELVRQRDDLAQLRDKETRQRDDEAKQRTEITRERDQLALALDQLRGERDAGVAARAELGHERDVQLAERDRQLAERDQRITGLEAELSETHKRWATERKEVVDAQGEEIAAIEATHKAALEAAVGAARSGELASAGIAIATVKAEADRDRQQLQAALAKLRDELERARADAAGELARLRESHDAMIAKLTADAEAGVAAATAMAERDRAAQIAELGKLRDTHVASLDTMRAEAQRATSAAVEKHKQDLAQVVFNNAADQGVMARRHAETVQRAEARNAEVERMLSQVRGELASRDASWEHKLKQRDDEHAHAIRAHGEAAARTHAEQLAVEAARLEVARNEIVELRKEADAGEALVIEIGVMRARLEGSEARTADLRSRLRVYFEKGIELVESDD